MLNLANYQIIEEIYRDIKRVVYRGMNLTDHQPVILKAIATDYPTPAEIARLKHEYEITKNLEIPGIVKTLALVSHHYYPTLVLEDFGGISLKDFLDHHVLDLKKFLQIAIQLTQVMGEIHQKNIIHKDIKPSNIIINPQTFEVKITDFSLASQLSTENAIASHPDLLEGTLAYMSPEQTGRMNRLVDYRTDFYSLGVTFYEMLTSQLPCEAEDSMELVHCQIARIPQPPAEVNSDIPLALSEIVMKLLAKTAEERYQSSFGLKTDLENCLNQLKEFGVISNFTIGAQDFSGQLQIPQKLYGREVELAQLLKAFEQVCSGKTEIILVRGYSGIGKSALVQEIQKPLVQYRGYFITGKFDQFKRNIPYVGFIQAFSELMRQLLTESPEKIQHWREKLLSALGSNAQVIIDVIPEVEWIIGKQPPVRSLPPTECQNRFNLVFQNFINVFRQKEHPLVLFLDDLQWADLASLKLIRRLVTELGGQYFLLIGAYRDHEVSATHPLTVTLEKITKAGALIQEITLDALQLNQINQLLAETLDCSLELSQPLAELLLKKTDGNPFFLTQLLKSLYQEKYLVFDFSQGIWQWNLEQLQGVEITDNVVELMVGQIQKLSAPTQTILKFAACIGNLFDLEVLAVAIAKPASTVALELWEALQAGLILPTSEAYKIPLFGEMPGLASSYSAIYYKFLHDRVQQAAYSLIPETEKKATHLKIGQLLLQKLDNVAREEHLFAIVNHLNLGLDIHAEFTAKQELAELNLVAARKAKAATAYESACRYAVAGLERLSEKSWDHNYDLTLKLYIEATETHYLTIQFEAAEKFAEISLKFAKNLLERVKIYELKMQICMAKLAMLSAIDIGLQVLEELEVKLLPFEPGANLLGELADLEQLENLPAMTDPNKLAAMEILKLLCAPVFMAKPEMFPQITMTMVNVCREYGNSPLSSFAYGFYGLLLSGTGNIEAGYKAGQIALNLLEKFEAKELKAKVYNLFNANIRAWKEPAVNSILPLQEGVQIGLETGDLEWGTYCASNLCTYLVFTGLNLPETTAQQKNYIEVCLNLKQEIATYFAQVWRQLGLNLQGQSENLFLLRGEAFNETEILPRLIAAKSGSVLFNFYVTKAILFYLFDQPEQALEAIAFANEWMGAAFGFFQVAILNFYHSLALLARDRISDLNQVEANQILMHHWAKNAPMNFQHKYDLVAAETLRVSGKSFEAMALYEQSIKGAREHGYLQEEALAYELAAQFYLQLGYDEIGQTYLKKSHNGYLRWGAMAKVADLESKYPNLLNQSANAIASSFQNFSKSTIATTSARADTLDFNTVIKASQALSGEVKLETLLIKLMQIILENAGAQSGILLLNREDTLWLEATGKVQPDQVVVRQEIPLKEIEFIPQSLINYVHQSQEDVVLDDARQEKNFSSDRYIIQSQPKSVLCTPILGQGKLIGILYLENNLTTGAFTPARSQLLKLLCSQAAIALENASLYEAQRCYAQTLELKVQKRTQALEQEILVRQQAETALKQEQEKFLTAFRSSPNPIAIARLADACYIEINDSFLDTFGFRRDEVIGQTAIALNLWMNSEDRNRYRQQLQKFGKVRNQELNCRTKSGFIKTMLVSADIIYLGTEPCILVGMNDITERKRFEDALQASEERYRAVVEDQTELICRFKKSGPLTFVNDAYCRYFNQPRAEIIQNNFIPVVPESDRIKIQNCLASLNRENPLATLEHRVLIGQGERWHQWTYRAIFDEVGEFIEFQAVGQDISDRKRAETALQQAKETADAASRAKGEFLSKMSHELRTPLNAILGFTQVLNRDPSLNSQQQEYLNIISRSGEHLLTLINDVLEMSKIEAGRIELNPTSFDLYRLLNSLEEMLTLKTDNKNLQLIFDIAANVPQFVKTDESKLRQVLMNLLSNAIKFTEVGGVALRVALIEQLSGLKYHSTAEPETWNLEADSYLICEVEDTGPGIAAEEITNLFDPFVQTETGRKSQSGTGLGLSITRQFVQLMGGKISVSSTVGKGTIFKFEIPFHFAEPGDVMTRKSPQQVSKLAPDQPTYRILVVEDKWESRQLLVTMLTQVGFEVREAVNGQEAATIWQAWQPHLIWMDMQMPVMDGYQATQQIKATSDGKDPVIIALTASAFEENRASVLAAGCDDFVSKPFRQEVIFEKMAEYLGVRYLYEETASDSATKPSGSEKATAWELTPKALAMMEPEWLAQLHQAASELDDELLAELIAQIPASETLLAKALQDLVQKLRFDKIVNLIEQIYP